MNDYNICDVWGAQLAKNSIMKKFVNGRLNTESLCLLLLDIEKVIGQGNLPSVRDIK